MVNVNFYKLTWTREFLVQILSVDKILGFNKYYEIRKCLRASVDDGMKEKFLKNGSDNEDDFGLSLENQQLDKKDYNLVDWSDSDNDADEKAGATFTSLSIKEECQNALEKIFREKETYDKMDDKKRERIEKEQQFFRQKSEKGREYMIKDSIQLLKRILIYVTICDKCFKCS